MKRYAKKPNAFDLHISSYKLMTNNLLESLYHNDCEQNMQSASGLLSLLLLVELMTPFCSILIII